MPRGSNRMNSAQIQTEIIDFWFGTDLRPEALSIQHSLWFQASAATDQAIQSRFGPTVQQALTDQLTHWAREPQGRLALILLLDQFTRNLYRGSDAAFSGDSRARELCLAGLTNGHYAALHPVQQAFFLMPLEHSEQLNDHEYCHRLHDQLLVQAPAALQNLISNFRDFGRNHAEIIRRFGRFPHRNRILGRTSSAEEQAFLAADSRNYGQN